MMAIRILALLILVVIPPTVSGQSNYFSGFAWETSTAAFRFDIEGRSDSGVTWNEAARRAMQGWNDATAFRFEYVEEETLPCLNGETLDDWHSDGINSIAFNDDRCDFDMGNYVIGIALVSHTGPADVRDERGYAKVMETDLLLNHTLNWDVFYGGSTKVDFERTVQGLLGYTLGIDSVKSAWGESYNRPWSVLSQPKSISAIGLEDRNLVNLIYGGGVIHRSKYHTDGNGSQIMIYVPEDFILAEPIGRSHVSGDLSDNSRPYWFQWANSTEEQRFDVYEYSIQQDSHVEITVSSNALEPEVYFFRVDHSRDIRGGLNAYGNSQQSLKVNGEFPAGTYWIGLFGKPGLNSGLYEMDLKVTSLDTDSNSESYTSIYGAEIKPTSNPAIKGSLEATDFEYDGRIVDLYELSIRQEQRFYFRTESDDFRTALYVISVNSDQSFNEVNIVPEGDHSLNSIYHDEYLEPGTYWIGIANQVEGDLGEYQLHISSDL